MCSRLGPPGWGGRVLGAGGERGVVLCDGVDTIVHAGDLRPPDEPSYETERRNVDMTQKLYRAAVAAGVKRIVCASTNQASKWYEQPYYDGRIDRISAEDYPRPDSFYGWAK